MSKSKRHKKISPEDDDFVLDDYALYNLNRTAATYNDEISKALKAYGLDTMQWRILMLLEDKSPSSVGELARRSVTKMPTVTRMLTRMAEQGLVKRGTPGDDKRFVDVHMTAKARRTLTMVKSIGGGVFVRAFEGIEASEIAQLTRLLKRMRENLVRSPYDKPATRRDGRRGGLIDKRLGEAS